MKKVTLFLLGILMLNCVPEVAVLNETTKEPLQDTAFVPGWNPQTGIVLPNVIRIDTVIGGTYPYSLGTPMFAKDGLPNSPLQAYAYKAAIRDCSQFGQFCGGFFFGLPYTVSTYFFDAHPKIPDKIGYIYQGKHEWYKFEIPNDSLYWYDHYYNKEVKHIRNINALAGTLTRWAIAGGITVLYFTSPKTIKP